VVSHRGDERFALCSTFKLLAAAFVLARVDRNEESLTRRIAYARDYLVDYSPITEKHIGEGLTLGDICEAAVTVSDNTAGNLLLDSFGGPAKLTAYLRSLGDRVTRLDRREPELNEVRPGDPRDTTAPVAMLEILRKTVLGTALSASSRKQLIAWLVANKTGDKRLRAGVPRGWRVGDKTGSGSKPRDKRYRGYLAARACTDPCNDILRKRPRIGRGAECGFVRHWSACGGGIGERPHLDQLRRSANQSYAPAPKAESGGFKTLRRLILGMITSFIIRAPWTLSAQH
jgi:hypothetical protein